MTSEPDGKPGRRPPTIELKATEVDSSAPPQSSGEGRAQESSTAQTPGQSGGFAGWIKANALSGAIGAIAMAAIVAALWIGGVLPMREVAAPFAAPLSIVPPSQGADLAGRLDKIEAAIKEQHRPEPAPANGLAALAALTQSLSDSVAALNRRADEIAATSQGAVKQAQSAQSAAEAAKRASEAAGETAVKKNDIDALADHIAALEQAVKAMSENPTRGAPSADDRAARLTVVAEALRATVERGAPYQAELAAVRSLGVETNAVAPLAPFAASGVPSDAALGRELAGLLPALQRATEPAPRATSLLGRLAANAQHLVRITPVDAPAGNDPSAIMVRLRLDAARADIATARADIAALPDAARPLVADWVKNAAARDAAIAASRQIAATALAALATPAAQ